MKHTLLKPFSLVAAWLLLTASFGAAQTARRPARTRSAPSATSVISEHNVRAEMDFLASDALQGRGSGTQFEWLAATYIGSQLQQFGVAPAGETDAAGNKTYVQTVNITRNAFAAPPFLNYSMNGANVALEHGKEMLVLQMRAAQAAGQLQKIALDKQPQDDAVVFVETAGDESQAAQEKLQTFFTSRAAAVIIEETPRYRTRWDNIAARPVAFTVFGNNNSSPSGSPAIIVVNKDAANNLRQLPDGMRVEIKGQLGAAQTRQTWNAIGEIKGSDARLSSEVILLSAHLDHLGVRENAPGADKIFNGADDDASGCIAVMELARVLASGKRPKRTVYFTFFGSEEAGGFGAQYFVDHLPFPKNKLVANLEFEMIGRPDALVKPDELWLTGYDRSNLGAELARRGAKLVADPHPEQNFFQRSDNYTLVRQGIIAHTVSSFGLHMDYHQVSDEIKTIDFTHMTRAINSMVSPVQWLVNSNFMPVWFPGKKP